MENPTVSLFFRFDESMFLPLPERCLCAGLLFACVLVCRQQIRSTPPRTTFRTTRILTGKIQARLDAGGTRSCLPPSRCSFQLNPNSDSPDPPVILRPEHSMHLLTLPCDPKQAYRVCGVGSGVHRRHATREGVCARGLSLCSTLLCSACLPSLTED